MEELHRLIRNEKNAAAGAAAAENHQACHPGWDGGCQDNPLFVSPGLGLDCAMHAELICDELVKVGFAAADMDELILNCPCSCNIEW